MFWTRRIDLLTTCVLVAAGAAGCQQAGESTAPVADASSAANNESLVGAAAPVSERDLARKKAFEDAIRGLQFEGGTVTVASTMAGTESDAWSHFEEGEALLASNQRTESIKAYASAVRTAPGIPDLYIGLGDAFITKGKTEYAAAAYRAAADLDPQNAEALSQLALTIAREGRTGEAIETMQSVLDVDPDNGFAHERLAIWEYYEGNDAAAWQHVREARRVGHDIPPQFVTLLERRTAEK